MKCKLILRPNELKYKNLNTVNRTLLLQSSDIIQNDYKKTNETDYQITLVKFSEHPFFKTNRSIGLYSITEDYFEQDVNSLFCKNNEFIENDETIGLLNLEKELKKR